MHQWLRNDPATGRINAPVAVAIKTTSQNRTNPRPSPRPPPRHAGSRWSSAGSRVPRSPSIQLKSSRQPAAPKSRKSGNRIRKTRCLSNTARACSRRGQLACFEEKSALGCEGSPKECERRSVSPPRRFGDIATRLLRSPPLRRNRQRQFYKFGWLHPGRWPGPMPLQSQLLCFASAAAYGPSLRDGGTLGRCYACGQSQRNEPGTH